MVTKKRTEQLGHSRATQTATMDRPSEPQPRHNKFDRPSVHTPHLIPSDFLHLIKYLEESRISSENRRWVEEEERRSREEERRLLKEERRHQELLQEQEQRRQEEERRRQERQQEEQRRQEEEIRRKEDAERFAALMKCLTSDASCQQDRRPQTAHFTC